MSPGPRPAATDRHRTGGGGALPAGDLAIRQGLCREFYILTMGLAGPGPLAPSGSGPLLLTMPQDRDGTRCRPVVMPLLTGAGAFGLFYGAARLARHIPPLNRAIGSVLHYADDGSTPRSWPPRPPTRWPS